MAPRRERVAAVGETPAKKKKATQLELLQMLVDIDLRKTIALEKECYSFL